VDLLDCCDFDSVTKLFRESLASFKAAVNFGIFNQFIQ
jgi:hypothetical protein